jgi:hypothetical protein
VSVKSTIVAMGVLAALVVGGSAYAARHSIGLGAGAAASAGERVKLERALAADERHNRRVRFAHWHPLKAPKMPPAPATAYAGGYAAAPAPVPAVAPQPVSAPAPVTHTTTATTDDGGQDD